MTNNSSYNKERKEVRIAVILPDQKTKDAISLQAKKENRTMSNLLLHAYKRYIADK